MNPKLFLVFEFRSPASYWAHRVHGPIDEETMKTLCDGLKKKYIWHSVIDVQSIRDSVPGAGNFRTDLASLVEIAISKPTLINLKAVTRHIKGLKRRDWTDSGEEVALLNCPATIPGRRPSQVTPDCEHCTYHEAMLSFAPPLETLLTAFVPEYRAKALRTAIVGNYYCKCSIHAAKMVLKEVGIAQLNAKNVGPFVAMLLSLKAILSEPPALTNVEKT